MWIAYSDGDIPHCRVIAVVLLHITSVRGGDGLVESRHDLLSLRIDDNDDHQGRHHRQDRDLQTGGQEPDTPRRSMKLPGGGVCWTPVAQSRRDPVMAVGIGDQPPLSGQSWPS